MMFNLFGDSSEFKSSDAARLRRMEQKLDLILKHLGIVFEEDELPAEARQFADRGEKIAAIKAYREATGAGLAEAKLAVERYLGQV